MHPNELSEQLEDVSQVASVCVCVLERAGSVVQGVVACSAGHATFAGAQSLSTGSALLQDQLELSLS